MKIKAISCDLRNCIIQLFNINHIFEVLNLRLIDLYHGKRYRNLPQFPMMSMDVTNSD
jgi:hypothetical protein